MDSLDSPTRAGSVVIRRYMDEARVAIVSRGSFGDVFAAWRDHAKLWDGKAPDGLIDVMMRQGLAAATLHLATKRRGEEAAFTVNFTKPPINLFLTGDNARRIVTGRAFTTDVARAPNSRFFVETRRGDSSFKSVIDVDGLDVVDIFDQYYLKSEQKSGRFYELRDDEFMMIFGLPAANHAWLGDVDVARARELAPETLKPLDEMTFWFQCGCDPERMLTAMRAIFKNNAEDLFRGDARVEVTCPRCGRRWWVTRERFAT